MTSRTQSVFVACDEIAAKALATGNSALRPTVTSIRERGVRGSQNDIQGDIHAWFMRTFDDHLGANRIEGMPPAVVEQFKTFWAMAGATAREELTTERLAVATSADRLQGQLEILTSESERAWAAHDVIEGKLSASEATVAELRQQVSDLKTTVVGRDAQVATLNDAMANLRADHASRIAEFEAATNLARERYEAMERKLLLEIDSVRTRETALKAEIADLKKTLADQHAIEDGLRQRAARLESQLASVTGKLEAVTERATTAEAVRSALERQVADAVTEHGLLQIMFDGLQAEYDQVRKECGRE